MKSKQKAQMNFTNPAYEWTTRGKDFNIQIRAWKTSDTEFGVWVWNVYALISEKHPLFKTPAATKSLHFHGGCTFDQVVTALPVEGIEYDWQKEYSYIKVGSDYAHYMDNYEQEDPKNGIPWAVQRDAEELFKELE